MFVVQLPTVTTPLRKPNVPQRSIRYQGPGSMLHCLDRAAGVVFVIEMKKASLSADMRRAGIS